MTFLQATAPQSGTLLWWGAFVVVAAPCLTGMAWVIGTGIKIVRFMTRMEDSVTRLTTSVQTLTETDYTRGQALHDAMQDVRNLTKVIGNVSSVNGRRYDDIKGLVDNHEERIVAIEKVPAVKRGLMAQ